MNKKIVMIGAGGHASVLADILIGNGQSIYAVSSPEAPKNKILASCGQHLISDDEILGLSPDDVILVNGIGSIPGRTHRVSIANKFRSLGYEFMNIIAASALVSTQCEIGNGVQILTRAIIQPGCVIGDDVIINTGAIVEHDCQIGTGVHLAPGVVLSGGVNIGQYTHLGTNSTVIQGLSVAENSVIGAGVTINKSIEVASIVYPAKPYIRSL